MREQCDAQIYIDLCIYIRLWSKAGIENFSEFNLKCFKGRRPTVVEGRQNKRKNNKLGIVACTIIEVIVKTIIILSLHHNAYYYHHC
jgi:hypothetical protein